MKTGHVTSVPEPSFVFEVLHGQTTEQKFESLLNGRKLMYAYHGSRIENFHSILHSGLANHMNKVSMSLVSNALLLVECQISGQHICR